MDEVICVDGHFPTMTLMFYTKHGVVHPKQDQIYQITEVIKYPNGSVGVQLHGLENPKIPVNKNGIDFMMEVSFSIKRFRKLNGDKITAKELENINVNA